MMKPSEPTPPAMVHNQASAIKELFTKNVIPSYGRFDIVLSHGSGSSVWSVTGQRYLDMGGGIAVCSLGHASGDITEALIEQSRKLVHISNLYYTEPQGRLARALVERIAPGKCFFANSGAEANEGLFKLARRFGNPEGRFEVLTAFNSFHGRTLAGLAATGQDKFRKGFEPITPGFRHIPFNDLAAAERALSPATAAILIEGVQGESGILPATPEYLLGLRKLCNEKNLLLLMDGVQCGHYRTGRFQSFQRILEGVPGGEGFLPDAISMAKSLGGGFPIGAFWVREPYADILGPGTHATTFGGTPLACAVALKVLEVIERDGLAENVRKVGAFLEEELLRLSRTHPGVITAVRALGLMIGFELQPNLAAFAGSNQAASLQLVNRLHEAGLLTIPAGTQVVRLLPPLNLRIEEAREAIQIIESVISRLI
jgi:acetylornithine/N-succinyldiaminopimelate aminotransferase